MPIPSKEDIKQSLDFLKAKDLEEDAKNIAIGFGKYIMSNAADLDLSTEQLFNEYLQTLQK